MDSFDILVIALAVTLGLFLLLAIALVIILISVAARIKRVTDTFERSFQNVENMLSTFKKAALPAAIAKFAVDQLNNIVDQRKKNKNKEE